MSRIRLGLMFHSSREVAEVVRTILDRAMPRGAELYAAHATGSWALTGYRIPVPAGYGLCAANGAKWI